MWADIVVGIILAAVLGWALKASKKQMKNGCGSNCCNGDCAGCSLKTKDNK